MSSGPIATDQIIATRTTNTVVLSHRTATCWTPALSLMYNPLNTPRFTPFQQLRRLLKPGHTRFAHARIGGSRAPSLWIYACLCLETHPSQSPTPEPSPAHPNRPARTDHASPAAIAVVPVRDDCLRTLCADDAQ